MHPTPPVVSVLLPVFNAERTLSQAVESILKQTFGDFELIAIDDGSTDKSLKILKTFAAADPRVRIISRPNTGIAGALNEGLATAPRSVYRENGRRRHFAARAV